MAQAYRDETQLGWPLLVDESRELYQSYGMLHAGWWDLWGPATWWAYIKELWRGAHLKESDGDISQRGGDVLIDPQGRLHVVHVGDGPADRPSVASLLEHISTVRAAAA